MAYQRIPGLGMEIPSARHNALLGTAPSFNSAGALIDATGEKFAYIGQVFFHARSGTKDIERVGFRFGTVTKPGGSGLTLSLQDVSTTVGPPMVPDESQDQTVAIANADASFATNTWYRTGTLSANRTVAPGDWLAVVIEFDGSGKLGSDAINFSALLMEGLPFNQNSCVCMLKSGAPTWGIANNGVAALVPNIVLEFSDGTFGSLYGAIPASAVGSLSYASNTGGADEYALEFSLPFPCKVDGAWVCGNFSGNGELVLYDGTTVMGTIVIDLNRVTSATARRLSGNFSGELTLAANTTYRLAFKPTTTTANSLQYIDVANAAHFAALEGGASFCLTSRLDSGAWAAATTTRRPIMGVSISSFDDGVSAGGPVASNMRGGFVN